MGTDDNDARIRSLLICARAVLRSPDFTSAARAIYNQAKALIGATAGYMALLSADGARNEVLFLDAGGQVCTVDPDLPMPIRGLRERAYATGNAVYDNDFGHSPWMAFMPPGHAPLANVLFSPLVVDGKARGLLGLANKPGGFAEADARLAELIGEVAAIALQHCYDRDQLVAAKADLERRVKDKTLALSEANAALKIQIEEHRRAVAALTQSEVRYRLIADNATDMISRHSPEGIYLYASPACKALLGYGPGELIGRNAYEFFHPDDFDAIHRSHTATLESRQTATVAYRIRKKDDAFVWVETTSRSIRDPKTGKILEIIAATRDISERKAYEDQLFSSRQTQRALLDASTESAILIDRQGTILAINETGARRLGARPSELVNRCVWDILAPALALRRKKILDEVLASSRPFQFQDQRDGLHLENSLQPILGPDGQVVRLAIFARDITAQKAAEDRLRADERITQARLALMQYAADHDLDQVLQQTLDQVGALTDSPIGFFHFVNPADGTIALQAWSSATLRDFCAARGKGLHYDLDKAGIWADAIRHRRPVIHNDYGAEAGRKGMPPGHAAVVREAVVPVIRADHVVAVLGVGNKPRPYDQNDVEQVARFADLAWDIAERKIAENELRQSEQRYRNLYRRTPAMLHSIDAQGRIIHVSDYWLKVMGYARHEVLGRRSVDFLTPASRSIAETKALPEFFQKGIIWDFPYQMVKKDGEIIDVRFSAIAEADGSGRFTHSLAVITDVTEANRSEAALQDSRTRLQVLTALLLDAQEKERSRISRELHDQLGQDLMVLKLQVQSMEKTAGQGHWPNSQDLVRTIDQIADNLRRLARDLAPAILEDLGLAPALRWQINELARHAGLKATVRYGLFENLVAKDREILVYRIVQEAMTNIVRHAEASKVSISLRESGGGRQIAIRDNGKGFDLAEVTAKDPARRGLGMAAMDERARMLGGALRIESRPGAGTTVVLELPEGRESGDRGRVSGGD